jgi:hypothetical protein
MEQIVRVYIKTKIFFIELYRSINISEYVYKIRRNLNMDYNHINVKEPMDDLARLNVYEENEIIDLHTEVLES